MVRRDSALRVVGTAALSMILTSGCFDGLHAGHIRYLQAADERRNHGPLFPEFLYCAVAPDSYIRSVKHREPYWSQADRIETLRALTVLSDVFAQGEEGLAPLIRVLRPRLFIKGIDWQGHLCAHIEHACEEIGCRIIFVETEARHGTAAHAG